MSDYVLINGELYHHGVKGMKWGVRKAYDAIAGYGYRKQKKEADKYANKAARAASNGNKIASKYYKSKSYRIEDSSYSDVKNFYAGIKDLSLKARSVAYAADIGKAVVKNIIENQNRKRANREIREWNQKQWGL